MSNSSNSISRAKILNDIVVGKLFFTASFTVPRLTHIVCALDNHFSNYLDEINIWHSSIITPLLSWIGQFWLLRV